VRPGYDEIFAISRSTPRGGVTPSHGIERRSAARPHQPLNRLIDPSPKQFFVLFPAPLIHHRRITLEPGPYGCKASNADQPGKLHDDSKKYSNTIRRPGQNGGGTDARLGLPPDQLPGLALCFKPPPRRLDRRCRRRCGPGGLRARRPGRPLVHQATPDEPADGSPHA
jgi:hypothetical protein